mmetsp:Transcript_12104/g.30652  ORF Transcript_12104/g.30652 Transcript_12104/m.30652 type:complete len:217 (+) Transcript_12104:738-1388(+)
MSFEELCCPPSSSIFVTVCSYCERTLCSSPRSFCSFSSEAVTIANRWRSSSTSCCFAGESLTSKDDEAVDTEGAWEISLDGNVLDAVDVVACVAVRLSSSGRDAGSDTAMFTVTSPSSSRSSKSTGSSVPFSPSTREKFSALLSALAGILSAFGSTTETEEFSTDTGLTTVATSCSPALLVQCSASAGWPPPATAMTSPTLADASAGLLCCCSSCF